MDNNKKFWEKFAKLYTVTQEKSNKEIYKELVEKIKPFLDKDKRVLELACGTGQLTFSLSKYVKKWEATDFSLNMVNETRKRSHKELNEEECKGVTFSVQDATALPYEDNSFDYVLIANALHIMPDPFSALEETKRVLKEGGLLIAPTFIYEGKINKFRLWIVGKAGFKTFYKWKKKDFEDVIRDKGFSIEKSDVIQGELLPELLVIAKK